ncbi:MAG: hypothetical protein AAF065_02860 [Verrucomicrobiota bacterium]
MNPSPKPDDPYFFIMGQSFPRSEIVKLFTILGFLLLMIVVGVSFFFFDWKKKQDLRSSQLAEQASLSGSEVQKAANPTVAFFDEFLEQTRFDEVFSINAVGIYNVNGIEMNLQFLAKRPRLYRQTLRKNDKVIEFGYDGETVWFSQSHDVVDGENEALMSLNRSLAILESAVPCLAWDYNSEESIEGFELMPENDWNGHPCYVIKNSRLLENTVVYHYIDKESGFEHYRRASLQIAPRRYRDAELFYKAPLEGSEFTLPSGIELLLDGRLYYKVTFESVEVNKGLLNILFEAPNP